MSPTVRRLGAEDGAANRRLSRLAFGGPPEPPPQRRPAEAAGVEAYGAFVPSGRLVAKAVDLEHSYWYGGRLLPGAGVAGVAVEPEHRGSGVLARVMGALLEGARERGAVVSALFPTTATPYRRLGWERTGTLTWTALPTVSLAGLCRPEGIEVRPAEPADVPALIETYRACAREGAGMLDRSGALFATEPAAMLAGFDGVTIAVGPSGTVEGYVSWNRGLGYDADAVLTVFDLVGRTPDATRALLALLGSWRSVTPTLHLRLADADPAWLLTGMDGARVLNTQAWMFRLVDAAAALAARGWPADVTGAVELDLSDAQCPWNAGRLRLELDAGTAEVASGGAASRSGAASGSAAGSVQLGPGGLAALYAGAITPALARRAGLLAGGDTRTDAFLTAAFAGPRPSLLDYF
jgi:predicted acetyltransferase